MESWFVMKKWRREGVFIEASWIHGVNGPRGNSESN